MKLITNISYLLFFFLIVTLQTDPASSQSTGSVDGPIPFELINLDDLLKSLNQTYASLTTNLANINSSVQNSPSNSNNQSKSAIKNDLASPANSPKKNQPINNLKDSKQLVDKTSTQQSGKTTPPTVKQTIKNSSITIIKDSTSVKSNSNKDSNSNKGTTQQPKTTVPVKNSSNSQVSITKSSTLPTFGPGPIDKSLPPVIDVTKMTTIYSYSQNKTINSSNSVNNSTLSSNTYVKSNSSYTSTSSASTEDSPLQQLQKLQEKQLQQIKKLQQQQKNLDQAQSAAQSQSIPQPKPKITPQKKPQGKASTQAQVKNQLSTQTKPETKPLPVLQQQSKPIVPIASGTNNLQSQSNQIYLSPINGNIKSNKKDDPLPKTVVNQSKTSSESNQLNKKISYYVSSKGALYNITPSYNAFKKYFVLSDRDQYLPTIQTYLITNYGNYLAGQQLIAGFRVYNEDNSLDYQILYSTTFGTFTSILTFYTDTAKIQLKSLSILNFYIMDIDYSNCSEKDLDKKNCKICDQGYRNFMGRCQLFDSSCLSYTTDECCKCSSQKKLIKGLCK